MYLKYADLNANGLGMHPQSQSFFFLSITTLLLSLKYPLLRKPNLSYPTKKIEKRKTLSNIKQKGPYSILKEAPQCAFSHPSGGIPTNCSGLN